MKGLQSGTQEQQQILEMVIFLLKRNLLSHGTVFIVRTFSRLRNMNYFPDEILSVGQKNHKKIFTANICFFKMKNNVLP